MISYQEYYQKNYEIRIHDLNQPLLKVLSKTVNHSNQKEDAEYIYLIPELVSLTGLSDRQQSCKDTLKDIAPFTKLTPTKRIQDSLFIVQNLNKSQDKIQINEKNARFDGFCLQCPLISFMQGSSTPEPNGIMKCRQKLKEPGNFKDWVFIYSIRSQNDAREADEAVRLLIKAG